jgi:hypothetical protein
MGLAVLGQLLEFERNLVIAIATGALNSALAALALVRVRRLRQLQDAPAGDRRPPWARQLWPEWAALGCVLLASVACLDSLQGARGLMPPFPLPAGVPARAAAGAIARSVNAQFAALRAAAWLLPWPMLTGLAALVLSRYARLCARDLPLMAAESAALPSPERARGVDAGAPAGAEHERAAAYAPRRRAALSAVALVLLPVLGAGIPLWIGVYDFGRQYSEGLGAIGQLPEGSDPDAFLAGLAVRCRATLAGWISIAFAGIAVGGALSGALAWRFSRQRARADERNDPSAWSWSASMGVFAVALAVLAEPLRQENQTPWLAAEAGSSALLPIAIETPDLHPTDAAPSQLPLVLLDEQVLSLDDKQVTATVLVGDLRARKPRGAKGSGQLIFACSPGVDSGRVNEVLRSALAAGYSQLWFAFAHTRAQQRPVIGTFLQRWNDMARVSLALGETAAAPELLVIDSANFADCATLCGELVRERAAGREVVLRVPAR